jgi:hypothetical protein
MAKKTADELQADEARAIEKGLREYVSPHAVMRDKLAEMRGGPVRAPRVESPRAATLAELEARVAILEAKFG